MPKVQVNGMSFNVSSNEIYLPFWDRLTANAWEPQTFDIFDRFLCLDCSYFDIGGWIGPTVLYGAQRARNSFAFEPDPVAFRELQLNLKLNPEFCDRIAIYNQCIAPEPGVIQLYAGGFYATDTSELGDSMSSIMRHSPGYDHDSILVEAITLQEFVDGNCIDDCNFIKMDIEGGEFVVLPSIQGYLNSVHPTLYVSFHSPPIPLREELFGQSFEILHSVYPYLYDASGQPVALAKMAESINNWTDDAPGSPWSIFDKLVGAGIVATSEEW